MAPELVAGGGYGGLIREKSHCARAEALRRLAQLVLSLATFPLQRPCERQKTAIFLQMNAKMYHFFSTEGHETRV